MSVITAAPTVLTGSWALDPAHSSFQFAIKHMGLATIRGSARATEGQFNLDADPALSGVIDATSLATGDEQRDAHLANPDFFDVTVYPEMTFVSDSVDLDGDEVAVSGNLTIKGQTQSVTLTGELSAPAVDPWGQERIGLDLHGVINRHDFGVSWNTPLPSGGLLLGDLVQLDLSLSLIKQGDN